MPKQIDYPRASMKNCFALAYAVNELGGKCSAAMAADKLNKKGTSGAFRGLIGAAVKYGLITNKKGQLEVTQLYRDVNLAYDENEATREKQKIFLSPPLFMDVFKRFENKPLPVSHFEKLLIREFDVAEEYASRVAHYFIEGAKQCGILGEDNILTRSEALIEDVIVSDEDNGSAASLAASDDNVYRTGTDSVEATENDGLYSVRIKGPGMDTLLVINEEEDLLIVKAMLKKVERRLTIEDVFGDD